MKLHRCTWLCMCNISRCKRCSVEGFNTLWERNVWCVSQNERSELASIHDNINRGPTRVMDVPRLQMRIISAARVAETSSRTTVLDEKHMVSPTHWKYNYTRRSNTNLCASIPFAIAVGNCRAALLLRMGKIVIKCRHQTQTIARSIRTISALMVSTDLQLFNGLVLFLELILLKTTQESRTGSKQWTPVVYRSYAMMACRTPQGSWCVLWPTGLRRGSTWLHI